MAGRGRKASREEAGSIAAAALVTESGPGDTDPRTPLDRYPPATVLG